MFYDSLHKVISPRLHICFYLGSGSSPPDSSSFYASEPCITCPTFSLPALNITFNYKFLGCHALIHVQPLSLFYICLQRCILVTAFARTYSFFVFSAREIFRYTTFQRILVYLFLAEMVQFLHSYSTTLQTYLWIKFFLKLRLTFMREMKIFLHRKALFDWKILLIISFSHLIRHWLTQKRPS